MTSKRVAGIVVALLGALAAAGCVSNVNRESMGRGWAQTVFAEEEREMEEDIAEIAAKRRQLSFPVRLAVVGIEDRHQNYYGSRMTILRGDQKIWEDLIDRKLVEDVVVLPAMSPAMIEDDERRTRPESGSAFLKRVRQQAARAGADTVFVYGLQTSNDKYWTPVISIFDLTIVGMFITPGRTVDSLSVANGMLVDVGNGVIYMSEEGEGRKTTAVPSAYAERDMYDEESRSKAVADLAGKLPAKLKRERSKGREE